MPRKQGKEPASTLDIIKKDLGYLKEVVKVTNDKTKQLAQSLNHYEKDTAPAMYDGTMERRIGHPTYKAFDKKLGKEVDRTRQWSIELFVWLIQEYRKVEKLPALPLSRILALARHGTILHVSIIARFKIKKKLDNSVPWSDLRVKPYHRNLFEKLEKEVNPYIPLGSCVRFWGARIILQKHWSNVQQSDYQKTDNHSGDDDDLQENNQESIDSTSTCSITGDGESSSESYSACTSNEEWDDEEESSTNEDGEDYDEDNETDASHSAQGQNHEQSDEDDTQRSSEDEELGGHQQHRKNTIQLKKEVISRTKKDTKNHILQRSNQKRKDAVSNSAKPRSGQPTKKFRKKAVKK
ncbi:hypothetical protein BJV82DRAFT_630071 [Fennellomyces sp. T-0311]|nr:hypothetical protein BJV82DRAFT_630071 [Fennellomyces sp. T-0311]